MGNAQQLRFGFLVMFPHIKKIWKEIVKHSTIIDQLRTNVRQQHSSMVSCKHEETDKHKTRRKNP